MVDLLVVLAEVVGWVLGLTLLYFLFHLTWVLINCWRAHRKGLDYFERTLMQRGVKCLTKESKRPSTDGSKMKATG